MQQNSELDAEYQLDHKGPLRLLLIKLRVHVINTVISLLPDDFISGTHLRPSILRYFLGMNIGKDTSIWGGSRFQGNNVEIGARCFVNRNCYFEGTARVVIGDDVEIGHGVTIITTIHEIGDTNRRSGEASAKAVIIESGCWVGANVTILPGVTIGKGVVVGAGSVVTRNTPDNVLIVGVPAKILRELPAASVPLEME
ncbi:MAG: DapH/DapD/GlmU-related protein [Candidatus Bathyarchaeia archaeon]